MNKSRELKGLMIEKLALVRRGANRVNYSVLKSADKAVSGKIFKQVDADEANAKASIVDLEDLNHAASILEDLSDVYQIAKGEVQDKIGEIIKHHNGQLPSFQTEETDDDIPIVTAKDLL